MFSSGPNYSKLKTNLRLAIARLKLLEKKKSELTEKSRREIADFIRDGKSERAKIRVEFIIREDYLVEAMEIVEMYCDLLLARFGLVTNMKEMDPGIEEAVSSLIWVAPRLQSDCQELKVIADLLAAKYGPAYAESCSVESCETISTKLKHKLSIQSPPRLLIEKYVIEIAKSFNVPYEPDPQVMELEKEGELIDLDQNNLGPGIAGFPQPPGFLGYPQPPPLPVLPGDDPFMNYNFPPTPTNPKEYEANMGGPTAPPHSFPYNIPPGDDAKESNTDYLDKNLPSYSMIYPDVNDVNKDKDNENVPTSPNGDQEIDPDLEEKPSTPIDDGDDHQHHESDPNLEDKPTSPNNSAGDDQEIDPNLENKNEQEKPSLENKMNMLPGPPPSGFPELPSVPSGIPGMPDNKSEDIDFDDLNRRFNELKKRK